jgi:L-methionine (R)-S-oxide reductase
MAEELVIPKTTNRKEVYSALLPQISALIETESDLTIWQILVQP